MGVIAVDGMGGDAAPESAVAGALLAANQGVQIILIGNQRILEQEINKLKDDLTSLQNFLHENTLTTEGTDQKPPHY